MAYLYSENLDPRARFDQLELQLDDGTTAILRQGHTYDLTGTEVTRARKYVVMTSASVVADEEPIGIVRLPIKGNPIDGQIPVWSTADGSFIPEDPATVVPGGGGGGTVTGITAFVDAAAQGLVTGGADQAAKLQSIFNAAPVGAKILLPPGEIPLSTTVVINKQLTLEGSGVGIETFSSQSADIGTRLRPTSNFTGTEVLQVARTLRDRPIYGVTLRDFTVVGRSAHAKIRVATTGTQNFIDVDLSAGSLITSGMTVRVGWGATVETKTVSTSATVGSFRRLTFTTNLAFVHNPEEYVTDISGNATLSGIFFSSNGGLINNVFVWRMPYHGFNIRGALADEGAPADWDCYESKLMGIESSGNGGDGVHFGPGATDMHLSGGSTIFNNQGDGIAFQAEVINGNLNGCSATQISEIQTYDNGRFNVWFYNTGSRTQITNLKCETAAYHGICIDCTTPAGVTSGAGPSGVLIAGSRFADNGDALENLSDHIHLKRDAGSGSINRTTITGNTFEWKGSKPRVRYGVNFSSSAVQDPLLVANTFGPATHFATSAFNDSSASVSPAVIAFNQNGPALVGATQFANDALTWTSRQRFTNDTIVQGLKIPTGLTIVPAVTGATTRSYRVSAFNEFGETLASAAVQNTNGPATLSATNFLTISWASVTGAQGYRLYGRTAGSETLIRDVYATSYTDDGGDTPTATAPPATAPAGNSFAVIAWEGQTGSSIYVQDAATGQNIFAIGADGTLKWYTAGATNVILDHPASDRLRLQDEMRYERTNATDLVMSAKRGADTSTQWRVYANGDMERMATGTTSVKDLVGTGTPEGVVTGAVGSMFRRTDGAAGTTLYIKETGTGATGWRAV
jgi:hypothetical protein